MRIHMNTEVGQSPLCVVLMEYTSSTVFSAFQLLWICSHLTSKGDAPKLTSISSTKQWQLCCKILNERTNTKIFKPHVNIFSWFW